MDPVTVPDDARPTGGITPYVNVEGAAEAAEWYRKAFGAEELQRLPAEDGKRLMHCALKINGGFFFLADVFPEFGFTRTPSNNYTMHLQVKDIDSWFKRAVDAGATVVQPLQDMFWGDRYGHVRDPYGVDWSMGETPAK